jgi:anti-sigma regulatory factor (Ser/Thr protein kinase)
MQSAGVEPAVLFDCLVAVTEACTNALLHGGPRDFDDPDPVLHWEVSGGRASFHVENYSREGWSRARHPSRATAVTRVEDLQVGGLGLDLMRDLMDEVDIQAGSAGTRVYLAKEIRPATS